MNEPMFEARHVEAAKPILVIVVIGILIVGTLLAAMGIALVFLGSTGATKMHFFGQSFDSANMGIAAIFLGAATIVLVLRSLLKRLKELAALP